MELNKEEWVAGMVTFIHHLIRVLFQFNTVVVPKINILSCGWEPDPHPASRFVADMNYLQHFQMIILL